MKDLAKDSIINFNYQYVKVFIIIQRFFIKLIKSVVTAHKAVSVLFWYKRNIYHRERTVTFLIETI